MLKGLTSTACHTQMTEQLARARLHRAAQVEGAERLGLLQQALEAARGVNNADLLQAIRTQVARAEDGQRALQQQHTEAQVRVLVERAERVSGRERANLLQQASALAERLPNHDLLRWIKTRQQLQQAEEQPPPPVQVQERLLLPDVFFVSDSTALSDAARVTLKKAVPLLNGPEALQQRVCVIGYADPTGTEAGNDRLSRQRAQRVADVLVEYGVDPVKVDMVENFKKKLG